MTREAVFLDRDGTIIAEVNYLARTDQVAVLPGAAEAIRRWNGAGVAVIVVTNQAGVGRGLFPEERVPEIHGFLAARLAEAGAAVDGFYYCPHHATAGLGRYRVACDCRKPKPGMLTRAAREWGLDLSRSWMIGDKLCDAAAGAAAGCRTILVRTGHGATLPAAVRADGLNLAGVADDLPAALTLWAGVRERERAA